MTRLNMPSKNRGITLIELLIALVISSILIAAVYRTFIGQQKTYTVQEQVVDMQQNVRVAINKMMREIRMAGFGSVGDVLSQAGGVNGFTDVIIPNANDLTIVGGFRQMSTLAADAAGGQNKITLANATDASEFDGAINQYLSIGGLESNKVQSRTGADLTLDKPLRVTYPAGTPVFKIHAIAYGIRNDDDGVSVLFRDLYPNTGSSKRETVAENIDNLQFEYFDGASPPKQYLPPIAGGDLGKIRMIRVTVTAKTNMTDPELLKTGDGYRRRTIASNIQVRNMGISP
jgi:prepilin-type N-terminal cleavage/methylation domain-containing protein